MAKHIPKFKPKETSLASNRACRWIGHVTRQQPKPIVYNNLVLSSPGRPTSEDEPMPEPYGEENGYDTKTAIDEWTK